MALPNVPAYCLNPDDWAVWGPECFPKEWPAPPIRSNINERMTVKGNFDPNAPPSAMESIGAWISANQTWVIIGIGALVVLMAMKGRR